MPKAFSARDALPGRQGAAGDPGGSRAPRGGAINEELLRRVPPHSVEAEQGVLAGILLRNDVFHTLIDLLTPDDFYLPAHRKIYAACLDLYRGDTPIDLITLNDRLIALGELENIGGAAYIADLTQMVVSGANAEYYATIVRNRSVQRALIGVCSDIIGKSFDSSNEIESLLDESEQAVFSVSERMSGKTFTRSSDLLDQIFTRLTERVEQRSAVTGVTTGYDELNRITAGLQPSDLIILAARPAMGKTAFALNMAMRAAVQDNVCVAIYSLEMSMEQLMMRMLCAWGKVDLGDVRRGYLDNDAWQRLYQAADVLARAPIFIDDSPGLSPLELRARTRRLKAENDVGLVVVDYLQLMRGARRTDSREQEISEISRSLKALAKEMNIPVLALSQLNRKLEDRTDKRPLLSDLRESGAIEQDADVIMFIYRDEVYHKQENNPNRGTAEIIIGKQRNGPTGVVSLAFMGAYTAFENLDRTYAPPESE